MAEELQQQGNAGAETGNDQASTGNQDGARSFSQADVDRIVKERLARDRQQFADYDDLKAAAQKWKAQEDAKKSELEKAADRLKELERSNVELAEKYNQALIQSALTAKAAMRGFADPMDAYYMSDLDKIQIGEDGSIQGVDDLLDALAKAKPYLLRSGQQSPTEQQRGQARISPTALPGGQAPPQETREQKRARIFGAGGSTIGQLGPQLGGGYRPIPEG